MHRRTLLQAAVATTGLALLGATQLGASATAQQSLRPLAAADANGIRLPQGFASRVIATTGQTVGDTGYRWHPNPDGGATFAQSDGGWVYVSNDEASDGQGGVSMVRFDRQGEIVDARAILSGTSRNCAGGPTPWGTWLSCEEFDNGRVWECDPLGEQAAVERPAMGTFSHEAAAADPVRQVIYLTEDKPDSALYRFTPTTWGDLSQGALEAMIDGATGLDWAQVPDPSAGSTPLRSQLPVKQFAGGEGAWFDNGLLYFTTKGDNRVWTYDAGTNQLDVLYDIAQSATPVLSGVDNVTTSAAGDLFVCEDGGNMEVVRLGVDGTVEAFLQMDVGGSEVTGVAFDPSGTRMYVSSQRNPGQTFEITGPFLPPVEEPTLTPTAELVTPTPGSSPGTRQSRSEPTIGESIRVSTVIEGHR